MAIVMKKKSATIQDPSGVGIRELRDNLSRHLEAVKEGGELTVTEHGKPVARIVPYEEPTRHREDDRGRQDNSADEAERSAARADSEYRASH